MHKARRALNGRPLAFVTAEELAKTMHRVKGQLWLGKGFEWERNQAQLLLGLTLNIVCRNSTETLDGIALFYQSSATGGPIRGLFGGDSNLVVGAWLSS